MNKKKATASSNTIARNKKARHDYILEGKFEAGIVLQGWEVKSLRQGKAQITDSFVQMKNGEAWLHGAHFSPLNTVSTHYIAEPTRIRKLLLNQRELSKLLEAIQHDGRTCVCTELYWKGHLVKTEICIATGKQLHDKRQAEKDRDWGKQKERIMRHDK